MFDFTGGIDFGNGWSVTVGSGGGSVYYPTGSYPTTYPYPYPITPQSQNNQMWLLLALAVVVVVAMK